MKRRVISSACVLLMFICMMTVHSFAYFNRGTVSLQLGQESVSIERGASVSVSVTVDPIKEQQLPGCGMAECPQSCGNTGCLNEYGECTCGGTEYQTYYSSVKAVSGNSSVATASYSNGTLEIKGIAAGSTTVTVTGSMRQYTDCTRSISVTVSDTSESVKSKPASDKSDVLQVDTAEINKIENDDELISEPSDDVETEDDTSEVNDEGEILQTKRGVYEIVSLSDDTDVKTHMQEAADNSRFVTFQKKSGENIDYSWTFDGTKFDTGDDIDLKIDVSQEIPDEIKKDIRSNALLLHFYHDGTLPAEADLYVKVSSVFDDGKSLKLLYWNEDSGSLETVSEDIAVENGYVTFPISHCSDYILTETDSGGIKGIIMICICAGVIIAAGILLLVLRLRKRRME